MTQALLAALVEGIAGALSVLIWQDLSNYGIAYRWFRLKAFWFITIRRKKSYDVWMDHWQKERFEKYLKGSRFKVKNCDTSRCFEITPK